MFSRFCILYLVRRSCCNLVTVQVNFEFLICKMIARKCYGICSKNIDMILPYLLNFLKNHACDSFSNIFLFSIYLCPSLSGISFILRSSQLCQNLRHIDSYKLIYSFVILIRGLTPHNVGARVEIKLGMVTLMMVTESSLGILILMMSQCMLLSNCQI